MYPRTYQLRSSVCVNDTTGWWWVVGSLTSNQIKETRAPGPPPSPPRPPTERNVEKATKNRAGYVHRPQLCTSDGLRVTAVSRCTRHYSKATMRDPRKTAFAHAGEKGRVTPHKSTRQLFKKRKTQKGTAAAAAAVYKVDC